MGLVDNEKKKKKKKKRKLDEDENEESVWYCCSVFSECVTSLLFGLFKGTYFYIEAVVANQFFWKILI